jgi:hypothetical protein
VSKEKESKILLNTTCFYEHKKRELGCKKDACRHWIDCKQHQNCTIIASESGPKTLQEIGDIFSVTRMRICQIEKTILSKLFNSSKI